MIDREGFSISDRKIDSDRGDRDVDVDIKREIEMDKDIDSDRLR